MKTHKLQKFNPMKAEWADVFDGDLDSCVAELSHMLQNTIVINDFRILNVQRIESDLNFFNMPLHGDACSQCGHLQGVHQDCNGKCSHCYWELEMSSRSGVLLADNKICNSYVE